MTKKSRAKHSEQPAASAPIADNSAGPSPAPIQPDVFAKAVADCQAGRFDDGIPPLLAILTDYPDFLPACMALGAAYGHMGRLAEARTQFERAIELDPKLSQAYANLGNVQKLSGDIEGAMSSYRKAIALQPGIADGHYNLSTLQLDMGDLDEAQKSLELALLFRPNYAEAQNNLGDIKLRKGKIEEAVSHFRQALVWNPDLPQAQANLVLALYRLGLYVEGEEVAKKALEARPDDTVVLMNQAMGLISQGKGEAAEAIYRGLIERFPESVEPLVNLGSVLQMERRYDEAADVFRQALTLRGVNAALCLAGLANLRLAQEQPSLAVKELQHAVMLESRHAGMLANLGWAFVQSGDVALGIENIRRATELAPKLAELRSNLVFAAHYDANLTPAQRRKVANDWNESFGDPEDVLPPMPMRTLSENNDRLRIGMVSSDFRTHSVAQCLAPLLQHYDRKRLEITLYSTSGQEDEVTKRFRSQVDMFRQVAPLAPIDLANRIRRDGMDILIDLSWHTGGNKLSMFALRPAPIQVGWLGFFADTGLDAIPFRLSDDIMDPPIESTEKDAGAAHVVYLPSVLCFEPPVDAPEIKPLPALRRHAITFASISRFNRASAATLDAWAQILESVPDSRLIVFSSVDERDTGTFERIRRLFALREIGEERLDIRPRLKLPAFLAALNEEVDVVLDTFPYPGGVSTLHALWMGVPTLTLAGTSSYERAGASIMTHAGMPDFVTNDVKAYVARAVRLATEIDKLAELRDTMRSRLRQSPLFDGAAFARGFEDAVTRLWQVEFDKYIEEARAKSAQQDATD